MVLTVSFSSTILWKLTTEALYIVPAISWLVGTVAVKLQSVSGDGGYQIVYSVEFSGRL